MNKPGSIVASQGRRRTPWSTGTWSSLVRKRREALPEEAAAAGAADDKHRRYPATLLPGGRLVPFSVETFGRWGAEATRWLGDAVDAVAERDPQVTAAGHWGKVAVLNAWHTRLSVALQKNHAASILQAGGVRGSADLGGESGWEEDIDDFLREAAAAAGWSDFEA